MTLHFDVWARATPNGTALGELTSAYDKEYRAVHQAIGSGQFTINRHDAQYAWCATDNLVRVRRVEGGPFAYDDSRYVGAFWIESGDDTVISPDEEGGEEVTRGGRTAEACLRWAIIYPDAFDSRNDKFTRTTRIDGNWHIPDRTAGEVLAIFLRDLDERTPNPLPFVTKDFGQSLDSNDVEWSDADTKWSFPVGTNLLDALGTCVSGDLYYRVGADFEFHAYEDEPGDDLSGTITFAKGVNIAEAAERQIHARTAVSRALVQGTKENNKLKFYEVNPDNSPISDTVETAIGRREGFVEFKRSPTTAKLRRAGRRYIRKQKKRHDGPTTVQVLEDEWVAFEDYEPGDVVTVNIPGEWNNLARRIYAIVLTEREAGDDDVTIEFEQSPFDPATGEGGEFGDGTTGGGGKGSCNDCPEPPPFTPVPDDEETTAIVAQLLGATNGPKRSTYPAVVWVGTGDAPPTGYGGTPLSGPLEYVHKAFGDTLRLWGIRFLAAATGVTIDYKASFATVWHGGDGTITFELLKNEVPFWAHVIPKEAGLYYAGPIVEEVLTGQTFAAGDVLSSRIYRSLAGPGYVPAGTVQGWIKVSGTAGSTTIVNEPAQGQVTHEQASLGTDQTDLATNYAYEPGSLEVFAEGVLLGVTEVDPEAGTFSLAAPLPEGTRLTIRYQATNGTSLGTGNLPFVVSANPLIPYPLLGNGGDGSGQHILHDDGTWRPREDEPDLPPVPPDVAGDIDALAFYPITGGGTTSLVQSATITTIAPEGDAPVVLDDPVSAGNLLIGMSVVRSDDGSGPFTPPSGWTALPGVQFGSGFSNGGGLYVAYKVADGSEGDTFWLISPSGASRRVVAELTGPNDFIDEASLTAQAAANPHVTGSVTPTGGAPTTLIAAALQGISGSGTGPTSVDDFTTISVGRVGGDFAPQSILAYRDVNPASGSYTASVNSSGSGNGWASVLLAFSGIDEEPIWIPAPLTVDGDDATYHEVTGHAECWRAQLTDEYAVQQARLVIACETSGSKSYSLEGQTFDDLLAGTGTEVLSFDFTATGSFTEDEVVVAAVDADAYEYYRLIGPAETRRIHTLQLFGPTPPDSLPHYQLRSEKGEADGYAPLDGDGLVPEEHLPVFGGGPETPVEHGNMGPDETIDVAESVWHRGTLNEDCEVTVEGFTVDEGLVALFGVAQDGTGDHAIDWVTPVVFGIGADDQPSQDPNTVTWYLLWSDAGDSVIYGAKVGAAPGGGASHTELTDVTADQHHAQAHALTGSDHTLSGLTTGHVYTATSATTAAFQPSSSSAAGLIPVDTGSVAYDTSGDEVEVTVTSDWGFDGTDPYYDSAGAATGEEAALFWDPFNSQYVVIPFEF